MIDAHPSSWVAPGAVLLGRVRLAADSSVWYQCVLRGDLEPIEIGEGSNVQDGSVLHTDPGFPAIVGARVTIGHRAVVHGARLGDGCLVGMGAVVLTGAVVGAGALVAAGAVVRESFEIPPGVLAAGVPARILRPLTAEEAARVARNSVSYVEAARRYRDGLV
jgi:carbonic anhydrase/acetyltransferase-like protein (isoleucine patch superfamily)